MPYIIHKVQGWSKNITTKPFDYKFFALFFETKSTVTV